MPQYEVRIVTVVGSPIDTLSAITPTASPNDLQVPLALLACAHYQECFAGSCGCGF